MTKKLLLIEDSFTTQQLVQTAFLQDDIDVVTTTTLAEALQEMQAVAPDVIVADASLPEVDGFQLCQMIRDKEGLRHIPVILLTSGFALYDQVQGERTGVTGHLSKPFEASALRRLVAQVFATPPHSAASPGSDNTRTPPGTLRSNDPLTSPSRTPEARDAPAAPPPQERQGLAELEAFVAQWAPLESLPAPSSDATETEALGRLLRQVIQDTFQTHLANMLAQLAPQILAAVREVVATQTPALLETLLQREIDTLKQAVDADDRDGD